MTVFERELKTIRKEIVKNSILACLASPWLALVIVGIVTKASLWGILLALFAGTAVAVLSILAARKYKKIQEQYESIRNTLKTNDVKLKSPKIKFLFGLSAKQTVYRCLLGIVLIDENQNRYYYVLPEPAFLEWKNVVSSQEKIKERFNHEISIQCYENTNVIRSVEKDIHFLRFRLGNLSD